MFELILCLMLDVQQPPGPAKKPNLEVIEKDDRVVFLDARFKITPKTEIFINNKKISFDKFFKDAQEEMYVTEIVVKKGELTKVMFETEE